MTIPIGRSLRLSAPKHRASALALFSLALLASGTTSAQGSSQQWGSTGEKWASTSRLPDFSAAGYHAGKKAIPDVPVATKVTDHGATANDDVDDTDAFLKAIAAAENGAVLIPKGRYKISQVLMICKSNVVLRGEGSEQSVLEIDKSLTVHAPQSKSVCDEQALQGGIGTQKNRWPYMGGFVWFEGNQTGQRLTPVTAPAARGSTQLSVQSVEGISIGQLLRLVQLDDDKHRLIKMMQAGMNFESDQVNYLKPELGDTRKVMDWVFEVVAIDSSSRTLTLDRPLRLDVDTGLSPALYAHQTRSQEVGVERLGFRFPGAAKKAHNAEEGYNAIYFNHVTNGWVRDVQIIDADYGINARSFVYNSSFEDIVFKTGKRSQPSCHHGLSASILSQDNLFNRYRFDGKTHCIHDVTVEAYTTGNVFSNGVHNKVSLDHHKGAPYENLFTNLHSTDGSTLFHWGGGTHRGPQSGVRSTFWNITADNAIEAVPEVRHFPMVNVIGLKGAKVPSNDTNAQAWVELSGEGGVTPPNLHASQVARKTGLYEAEHAQLSGAVARTWRTKSDLALRGFRGAGFVDFVNNQNDFIEWSVHVPETTQYTLQVRYALDGNGSRELGLSINGGVSQTVQFKGTGGWDRWATLEIPVSLPVGDAVKIRATALKNSGPDVDYLRIARP